ncbi:MAG: prolipoprotein diacylglyceryl transferase, partial [Chloroflexi bacterium]|nr:prolipoprotein diacylglyceryl transferase [Chloroflexota bacterium]
HPDAAAYVDGVAIHPVALYEGFLVMAVLGLLWALRTGRLARFVRPLPEGAAYVGAIGAYAAGRFVIGFARVDPSVLGLQQSQWVALAVLAGVAYYAWRTWAQPSRSS